MAHAKDVEDLVGLDGALPEAAEVNPVLSSNAGEGTSATPAPTVAGEGPAPAPAPTSEGDLKVVAEPAAEPATEDPTAAPGPRRWLNKCWGFCKFCLCDTEPWLLRRFFSLGLRTQPLLTMLFLWQLQSWLLMTIRLALCLSVLSLMIMGV
jgi:hypothetical protein